MGELMVICDTNVIIEYFKGNNKTKNILKKIGFENISISSITVMELLFGALDKKELKLIQNTMDNYNILHLNEDISKNAIDLIGRYSKSHNLDIPDALIAATAIKKEISLFTYNNKDFRYIEDIVLFAEPKK